MHMQKHQDRLTHPRDLTAAGLIAMVRDFGRMQAAGGIVLILASALALIVANSALYPQYDRILNDVLFHIGFVNGAAWDFQIEKSLLHWINDGLMVIFFFLVGLEIKEEMTEGSLATRRRLVLPAIAAIGGMAVPAVIYALVNMDAPENLRGWAIPSATDIAFALCVLSLLGNRVPLSLKILLTAIAIIDDLGAILIIALFYADALSLPVLLFCLVPLGAMAALNRAGVCAKGPYIVLGLILWAGLLHSGIHATLAGVATAMLVPVRGGADQAITPNSDMQAALHPWVAFLILPVFGFANAGVPFTGMGWHSLLDPVTLGIAAGLFIGKQTGVFLFTVIPIRFGWAEKPHGANWAQIYGVALLCGIGFTMSLFIGGLAFGGVEMQAGVRLGVLVGSLTSAVLAYGLLRITSTPSTEQA